MAKPKVIVLRTAGTNCDMETAFAFESLGANVDYVHINRLFKKEVKLIDYDLLALPGGFSYGDDVAAGRVLGNELKYRLYDEIKKFVKSGRLVIGICNGFQVLVKCGLLPGYDIVDNKQYVTLAFNESDVFECRWVHLKKSNSKSPFLKYVPEIIHLPIAHAEGKFITKNKKVLKYLIENKQIAFRYVDSDGNKGSYPINPNGSIEDIAGICNEQGTVLGMMPHPERYLHFYQHPEWTSMKKEKYGHGYYIFQSAMEYLKKKKR
ncbi:phosphoribosylformylglycinamidine synthase subunit PurQ [bacterium]